MSATLWNSVLYVPFLWVDNRISSQCFSTFFFPFLYWFIPLKNSDKLTAIQSQCVVTGGDARLRWNWKKRDTVSLTFKRSGHPNYKNIHFPPSFVTTVQINRAVKLLQMLTSVSWVLPPQPTQMEAKGILFVVLATLKDSISKTHLVTVSQLLWIICISTTFYWRNSPFWKKFTARSVDFPE